MVARSSRSSFSKHFITDQQSEENDNVSSSVTGGADESPPSSSIASPRKGKRSMQKKVVSVPIKDVEGSRLKGETTPPSDSWAWRKYGQKPIKGSPYPRGYYRCSSSKGCPARKQVERSRLDPTMLLITYSCEHNHPWPAASRKQAAAATAEAAETPTEPMKVVKQEPSTSQTETEQEDGFAGLTTEDSILTTGDDQFAWFGEMETTSSTVLESPLFTERDNNVEAETAVVFPMKEEDESLFADLGELPECSFVFRHQRNVGPQVGIC